MATSDSDKAMADELAEIFPRAERFPSSHGRGFAFMDQRSSPRGLANAMAKDDKTVTAFTVICGRIYYDTLSLRDVQKTVETATQLRPRLHVDLKQMRKKAEQVKRDRAVLRAIGKERKKADDLAHAKREYPAIMSDIKSTIQDALGEDRDSARLRVELEDVPGDRHKAVMSYIRAWIEEDCPGIKYSWALPSGASFFDWTAPAASAADESGEESA